MNLFDTIQKMDPIARVAAFRAICNSSLARAIGSARQAIRERERTERQDEAEVGVLSQDQRNAHDENARVGDEVKKLMGFETTDSPELMCSRWMAIWDTCNNDLKTLDVLKWQQPMTVKEMLRLMLSDTTNVPKHIVEALVKATGLSEASIREIAEIQAKNDRANLERVIPEIIQMIESAGDNGYDDSIETIGPVNHYRLYVKTVEGLMKARDRAIARIAASRSLKQLGDIPLVDDAIEIARRDCELFEDHYREEIGEAIERGVNIQTLEDLDSTNRLRL